MPLLWQNVRHGARIFLRRPGFPAVTAFSLALGIGANTAIFSILDAVAGVVIVSFHAACTYPARSEESAARQCRG